MIPHGTAHDRATAIAGLAVALVVLVSCGAAAPAGPTAEPLDGTYTASGGGGALPAVQALTARFHELHPETTWIVSESGSNSAIKLVLSKTIDVGFVSRALTDLEKQTVTGIPIGFSGTAVVVNAANPLSNLSKEDLRRIYTGEVTSWVDLGGSELIHPRAECRDSPDLRGLCLRRSDRHLRQECDPADRGRGDAGCCELVPRLDRDCQHRFSNRK